MKTSRHELTQVVTQLCQKLLGVAQVGSLDNFFQLGGDTLLVLRLLSKLHQKYGYARLSWRGFCQQPTITYLVDSIENAEPLANGQPQQSLREQLLAMPSAARSAFLAAYLQEEIVEAFGIADKRLFSGHDLLSGYWQSITLALVWSLKRDFQLPVYEQEILARPSLPQLVDFVLAELESRPECAAEATRSTLPRRDPVEGQTQAMQVQRDPGQKNPSLVFLLSAPRSGSTLLRLMLAGHSSLFCPPELNLLHHDTLQEWVQNRLARFPREHGVVHNLLALLGFESAQCEEILNDPSQQGMTIQEVYRRIQERAAPRTLVDKTPSYAKSVATLARGELLFAEPRYIHLVRHPYAVIESFVRQRFHQLISTGAADPYSCAEEVWTTRNQNILGFCQALDPLRYHVVRFEDLVLDPATAMHKLCAFLQLPFEDDLLHPYDGWRMIGGPGDYDILQHETIDARLGEIWREIRLPRPLGNHARKVATLLGYVL